MSQPAREQSRTLRDSNPANLRALAHPLRVEMLAILESDGEHTASELAVRLNQTVANCSFHLRTLAKYGYITRAEARGREKPWRAVFQSREHVPDPNDPESVREAGALASLYVQRAAGRLINTFENFDHSMPGPEWVAATRVVTSEFWATAEEMAELTQQLSSLLETFAGRNQNPALRPPGARRGHLFAAVNPDPNSTPWEPPHEPEIAPHA